MKSLSKNLYPFFCYFGGKWRAAKRYPKPRCQHIIEPFAGAAGYSLRYPYLNVTLYDLDTAIYGMWDYLIRSSEDEIRSLPLEVQHVDDLDVCQEAKWLIGFWCNKGAATPHLSPSAWMRSGIRPNSYWGEVIRERIAKYDGEDTFYYADSPYYLGDEKPINDFYGVDFTPEDHRRLAHRLRSVKGNVLLCNYFCKFIRDLYPGWRVEVKDYTLASAATEEKRVVPEAIFMNY